jgi:transcriptional regulator with XRE-family HTH domain
MNAARRSGGLTWPELAQLLGTTPSQLSGMRTARFAVGMRVAMKISQWLERPAADFVYAARW